MPDERANELAQRLRKAEEAASYMERLETLASEAPTLREQVSLLQRMEERENHRKEAMENARVALSLAAEAQRELPELIASAANLVNQMARALREVDTFRREATAALSVVDRMDYEDELDRAIEEQDDDQDAPIQRDAQSIRMLVASRHGSARVRRMIDQLSPSLPPKPRPAADRRRQRDARLRRLKCPSPRFRLLRTAETRAETDRLSC